MKIQPAIFFGFIVCIFLVSNCAPKNEQRPNDRSSAQTIASPKVTVLSQLADSIQPVVYAVDNIPKQVIKSAKVPIASRTYVDSISGLPLPPAAQGNGHFINYTTNDGLPNDAISCGLQDKIGHLWFGTSWGGLSRFDGSSFTNFTMDHGLPSNRILSLYDDRFGNLWIGTSNGLSHYDGRSFKNYTMEQGLAFNDVRCIVEDHSGNLWFGTWGGGVSKFNGTSFTTYTVKDGLPNDIIRAIYEDSKGHLWFGTWGGGVSRFDGTSFQNFSTTEGLISIDIWSIEEDARGNLWFAAYEGGVSRYDGSSFRTYNTTQGLPNNDIRIIKKDSKGNLWFGSRSGGVSVLMDSIFIKYTTDHGLTNNNVFTITEDKTGNLWFGTQGGGVSCYSGSAFINFTAKHGLADTRILCISEDSRGNLWFGSWENGASKYDRSSFINYTIKDGLIDDNIWCIKEDQKGLLWFGTDFGLGSYDGRVFISYSMNEHPVQDAILGILEDNAGTLWLGTAESGLFRYDGTTFTNYKSVHGLADNHVSCLNTDNDDRLWIGTHSGVSCYDGLQFINFTTEQGLMNNNINCIETDTAGNLWIATENGLNLMRRKVAENVFKKIRTKQPIYGAVFQSFSVKNNLPHNNIKQIMVDHKGKIFVGTSGGIAILKNGPESFNNETSIEVFNYKTGYPVDDVRRGQSSMFEDSERVIWIATGSDKSGLVRFDYNNLHKKYDAPIVVIESIKVGNERISWSTLSSPDLEDGMLDSLMPPDYVTEEVIIFKSQLSEFQRDSFRNKFLDISFDTISGWYAIPSNLILPYHHNNLTFNFKAIVTSGHHLMKFQYFLEGYDKEWSPISENVSATFGNIHEGKYVFKVKARSPEGVWSEPLLYEFRVRPPTHRTWWAFSIYSLAFLSLIYTGHRYQKKQPF